MTDYERRVELLSQTKGMKSESYIIGNRNDSEPKSTLGMRIMVCILCFICYVLFDYGNMSVMKVNSKVVTNQIKREINVESLLHLERLSL